jgi:hypothetical protein
MTPGRAPFRLARVQSVSKLGRDAWLDRRTPPTLDILDVKNGLTSMTTSLNGLYPLAERRAGCVTTAQAAEVGVSRQQLSSLARTGSLQRVAQGIYRLCRFPAQRFEDVIVACLWAGDDAVASHDTALAFYELTDAMPSVIHVSISRAAHSADSARASWSVPHPSATVSGPNAAACPSPRWSERSPMSSHAPAKHSPDRQQAGARTRTGDPAASATRPHGLRRPRPAAARPRGDHEVSEAHRYRTQAALRTAIEEHLRQRAHNTGVPLDPLRMEVAHQRLLARLVVVAPTGSWTLKGGQALLPRLGSEARTTKDADATWRAALDHFADVLEATLDTDLGDGFRFEAAAPRPTDDAETDEGGLRYAIPRTTRRKGARGSSSTSTPSPTTNAPWSISSCVTSDFAGSTPPIIPAIPVAQHLAEKLHAYVRDYGSRSNSRPRDSHDMLVIARSLPIPDSASHAGLAAGAPEDENRFARGPGTTRCCGWNAIHVSDEEVHAVAVELR